MTLQEHYKYHSRKSIKPYFRLFAVIVLLITAFNTFARYSNTSTATYDKDIAGWNIRINGSKINETQTKISNVHFKNVSDGSYTFQAGDTCYFDLEIDPTDTGVSFSYNITVDLDSENAVVPQGTIIEEYEEYVGNANNIVPSTYTVEDDSVNIDREIVLNQKQILTGSSIHRYRFYCSIPNNLVITDGQNFKVCPVITIEQITGED